MVEGHVPHSLHRAPRSIRSIPSLTIRTTGPFFKRLRRERGYICLYLLKKDTLNIQIMRKLFQKLLWWVISFIFGPIACLFQNYWNMSLHFDRLRLQWKLFNPPIIHPVWKLRLFVPFFHIFIFIISLPPQMKRGNCIWYFFGMFWFDRKTFLILKFI